MLLRILKTFSLLTFSEALTFVLGKCFSHRQGQEYIKVLEKKNKFDYLFINGVREFYSVGDTLVIKATVGSSALKFQLRIPGSDVYVFKQIILEEEFAGILGLFQQTFKSLPNLIVDAGSNIACASLYFLAANPQAKILAIEPSRANLTLAKLNVAANNFTDNIIFLEMALWPKNERLAISNEFRDGLDWSTSVVTADNGLVDSITPGQTFDHLNSSVIDLFKIDIEGAEVSLFSESADLEWIQFVKMITIEIHHEFGDAKDIIRRLEDNGFHVSQHGELAVGVNYRYDKL